MTFTGYDSVGGAVFLALHVDDPQAFVGVIHNAYLLSNSSTSVTVTESGAWDARRTRQSTCELRGAIRACGEAGAVGARRREGPVWLQGGLKSADVDMSFRPALSQNPTNRLSCICLCFQTGAATCKRIRKDSVEKDTGSGS